MLVNNCFPLSNTDITPAIIVSCTLKKKPTAVNFLKVTCVLFLLALKLKCAVSLKRKFALGATDCRPSIHSDLIWMIQIFSLKFSEIQITWLKIQIFFGFEIGRDFYYKSAFLVIKFRFFFSHSFRFCGRSVQSATYPLTLSVPQAVKHGSLINV